ncbi:MAG TPA: enoyl-CoA hydratase/isomerase family protein, partial [Gemmataceae bacterium]|nr:enoyl-CoA hydratase/isomerase family protein [Gemmataceae bacterium]
FQASRSNGTLTLTLDSPGSRVNVLNRAASIQLQAFVREACPEEVRAIVIRTAKKNSFINGVGLMLAQATKKEEDAARFTACVRDAYQSLRDARVPVIAAVQGNCYGCGVEFLLHCKYRIAAETEETHFYMTELADYLFIPLFRSTQYLPEQVGLANSIDLLLWGDKWSAAKAAEQGLVNATASDEGFDARVDRFVERVLAGDVEPCFPRSRSSPESIGSLAGAAEARIESLPSAYRHVYEDCLNLLVSAARGEGGPGHHAREMAASGRSAASDISKAAFGFFYVRQIAEHLPALGAAEGAPVAAVSTAAKSGFGADLLRELESRIVPGVRVVSAANGSLPSLAIRLTDFDSASETCFGDVAVALQWREFAANPPERVAYCPLFRAGTRFFELALRRSGDATAAVFAQYLSRAGFSVALSRPVKGFGLNQMIAACLRPVAKYLLAGGSPALAEGALREFGFVRGPAWLWDAARRGGAPETDFSPAERSALALLRPAHAGDDASVLVLADAVCLSLLACTPASGDAAFYHPALADLAAREVLDFPLGRGSLCKYLTRREVRRVLQRGAALESLVAPGELQVAENFVRSGREFYR